MNETTVTWMRNYHIISSKCVNASYWVQMIKYEPWQCMFRDVHFHSSDVQNFNRNISCFWYEECHSVDLWIMVQLMRMRIRALMWLRASHFPKVQQTGKKVPMLKIKHVKFMFSLQKYQLSWEIQMAGFVNQRIVMLKQGHTESVDSKMTACNTCKIILHPLTSGTSKTLSE